MSELRKTIQKSLCFQRHCEKCFNLSCTFQARFPGLKPNIMQICCSFILAIIKLQIALIKHNNKQTMQSSAEGYTHKTYLSHSEEILWHFEQKAVLLAILRPLGECENFGYTFIYKLNRTQVCKVCKGMYVGVKVCNIHTVILYVTDLLIPCLEVYALNFYSDRQSRLTTVLINLKIYIPLQTKMSTKFLHRSAPWFRFKICNKVNSTHIHNFTIKSNQDFFADKVRWHILEHITTCTKSTAYYVCLFCVSTKCFTAALFCFFIKHMMIKF